MHYVIFQYDSGQQNIFSAVLWVAFGGHLRVWCRIPNLKLRYNTAIKVSYRLEGIAKPLNRLNQWP